MLPGRGGEDGAGPPEGGHPEVRAGEGGGGRGGGDRAADPAVHPRHQADLSPMLDSTQCSIMIHTWKPLFLLSLDTDQSQKAVMASLQVY